MLLWQKLLSIILILILLALIGLIIYRPSINFNRNIIEPNYQSIYYGESENGWSKRRVYFKDDETAMSNGAIKISEGNYICKRGTYMSTNSVNSCDNLLHKSNYIPVSDLSKDLYDTTVIKEEHNITLSFNADVNDNTPSCTDLCDSLEDCIGLSYENGVCSRLSSLQVKETPLEHIYSSRAKIYLKKNMINSIELKKHIIFDSFPKKLVKWFDLTPHPGRTVLNVDSDYVILLSKPERVYNQTGKTIIYYNNVIDDPSNPPSGAVEDFINIPFTWDKIYAYIKP
jgi:hypothetical protein